MSFHNHEGEEYNRRFGVRRRIEQAKQKKESQKVIPLSEALKEIETKYADRYEISFQFWGVGRNAVFIDRNGVELYSYGFTDTFEEIVNIALQWLKRVNK